MANLPNADQRDFWSDDAGRKWVAHQEAMDALLGPVLDGVFDRAALGPGDTVLDIGCGAGTSTMRAAELAGPNGHAVGADISDTLLALARSRAEGMRNVSYIHADAATHVFPAARFDHLISRFGVMFFDDPHAAFRHIANGLCHDAHLTMGVWGAIDANPFFTLAAKAARDILGPMPKSDPDAPGPFAMRDPDRIIPMLREAGLENVQADRQQLMLTPQGTIDTFADLCGEIGPAQSAMRHFEASPDQRAAVRDSLIKTFRPFETEDGAVRIPAEIIYYTARA